MIELRTSNSTNGSRNDREVLWFAAIFAVVTYLALSTRAILNPYEVQHFVDSKRLLSVVVGASVLWFAIRTALAEQTYGLRAQISIVIQISILGSIIVFLSREVYDLAVYGEMAQQIGRNFRWLLSWIGYFAAAVASFFAIFLYRQLKTIGGHNVLAEFQNVKTDDMADHEKIAGLLALLQVQTGYETADVDIRPEAEAFRQRQRRIEQLLVRFMEPRES